MNHFTSTAYIVHASIAGRDGQYGSTTSVVGIFNTEKRAEAGKAEFIEQYVKRVTSPGSTKSSVRALSDALDRCVTITPITPNKINEVILSEVYE